MYPFMQYYSTTNKYCEIIFEYLASNSDKIMQLWYSKHIAYAGKIIGILKKITMGFLAAITVRVGGGNLTIFSL